MWKSTRTDEMFYAIDNWLFYLIFFLFFSTNIKSSSSTPWQTSKHYSSLLISICRLQKQLFIGVHCLQHYSSPRSSKHYSSGSSTEHYSPVYSFIHHRIHFHGNPICRHFDNYQHRKVLYTPLVPEIHPIPSNHPPVEFVCFKSLSGNLNQSEINRKCRKC